METAGQASQKAPDVASGLSASDSILAGTSGVLSKSLDVVARKVDEEFIIVPIRQNASDLQCIYSLDGIASRVWELIDGDRNVGDIVDVIVEEYDVTPDRARADIDEFVAGLAETGCATWQSLESGD